MTRKSPIKCIYLIILMMYLQFVNADTTSSQLEEFRLPGNLIPVAYNLMIFTDLDENKFRFWGNVKINVQCVEATNTIYLHSKNLKILENEVIVELCDESAQLQIDSHSYEEKFDFYKIALSANLLTDTCYQIYIPFEAPLGTRSTGYFRSSYVDAESGDVRWLSLTQFDPIDARTAFPCFDEVNFKATFTISLAHNEMLTALSNMRPKSVKAIEDKPGWVLSVFDESVPLPTTNVAFIICDLSFKELPNPRTNIPLRVWARKDVLYQVDLALDTLAKALPLEEQMFRIDYPLPKLDMVAVPEYEAGSESFFGLIFVREIGILFDADVNSNYNLRNAVEYVCEMTNQQWFDNLVTQKWWDGLWLGTGLVTYYEKIVTDQLHPNWQYSYRGFISNFVNVLSADSSSSAHPLQMYIKDPSVIDQLYDTITFEKGSFILRMLNIIVGEDVFLLGVSNFLKQFKFIKADQYDLWNCIADAAQSFNVDVSVKPLMDTWTLQAGYPYLFVDIDYNRKIVTVTQERYLYSEKTAEEAALRKQFCWIVILTFTTSTELNFKDLTIKEWLTCDGNGSHSFPLELSENDWVIFNVGLTVLCQINYSEKNWEAILNTLVDKSTFELIDVRNRMQILNDLFSFASAEIIGYPFVFSAIMYLQYEMEWLPWDVTLSSLKNIRSYLHRTDLFEPFQAYVRQILEPVYAKLGEFGVVPEDYYEAEFKYQMTFWSCEYEVDSCQKACLASLRSWEAVPNPDEYNPIDVDIQALVYCQGLRIANENDWYFLWDRYRNLKVPVEKAAMLTTLGCIQIQSILREFLSWSIDPNYFQPQDSFEVFLRVADSGIAYEICKEFFMKRFQEIYDYLGGNPEMIGQYLPILYDLVRTKEELKELDDFVETIRPQLKGTELQLNDSIEFAKFILAWLEKYTEVFSKILSV